MVGLSEATRDLDVVHAGLAQWFRHGRGAATATVSPFAVNASSGFSSESLLFDLAVTSGGVEQVEPMVLRLAPAGGGLFPEYDLARQAATQNLLADLGVPAAAPAIHEADETWIGTDFLVMPRIAGRLPADFTYILKGWLKDEGEAHQRACCESFADLLVDLHGLDTSGLDLGFLDRLAGRGLAAELEWWADYLDWAGDGSPNAVMVDAYRWARDTQPADDALALTWGDARFSHAIFDDGGRVVGALDWEQAALGPPELDVGFWLATRRQSREALGVTSDPELPGLLAHDQSVARVEAGLGRPLRDLAWHETFAMVRMGTCIAGVQRVLRRSGQDDHLLMSAPLLPGWVVDQVSAT